MTSEGSSIQFPLVIINPSAEFLDSQELSAGSNVNDTEEETDTVSASYVNNTEEETNTERVSASNVNNTDETNAERVSASNANNTEEETNTRRESASNVNKTEEETNTERVSAFNANSREEETNAIGDDDSTLMSLPKATFTLLCQILGGSDLSLPYAVSQGGIVVLVLLVALPFFCSYTALILIKCMYISDPVTHQKKRVRSSYSDLSEACWHGCGRKLVFFLHSLVLLMVSSLYLVLGGSFLTHAFLTFQLTKRMWTAIGMLAILPFVFLKSLSKLAWVSFVGVVVIVIPIAITMCYSFAYTEKWETKSLALLNVEGIPLGINIVIFTYGGHAILPRIEKGMANPKQYYKVILSNYIFGAFLKFSLALIAYLMFTSSTHQLITNNLPPGAWTIITSCCLGLKVLCSYPFMVLVLSDEIEHAITFHWCVNLSSTVRYCCIRLVLVFLTLGLALLIPEFGTLIAFIGSIGASLFVFCLPGLFNLLLRHKEISTLEKVLDVFVIVLGICSCVFGLYFASKAVVSSYTT